MENINEKRIIKNIEKLGERYCQECFTPPSGWNTTELEENWWEALKFFFGHSFFGGRPDKLSNEYYYFTIQVLESYFNISNENLDNAYNKLISATEDKIRTILQTPRTVTINWEGNIYEEELCLTNPRDIEMALEVLNFIRDNNKKNIYLYLKNEISEGRIKNIYDELQKIYNIGDKKACFIIRDILLMNPDINIANKDDYRYAFPVDTWVRKLCNKLGVNYQENEEIKEWFINKCFKEYEVDPLKVAAGLWYLGFNSLDIALELLERCEI